MRLASVSLLAMLVVSCSTVDDGYMGYEKPWLSAIQPEVTQGPGTHFFYFLDNLVKIDHREKVAEYEDVEIRLASQKINLKTDFKITWRIIPGQGGFMHRELGLKNMNNKRIMTNEKIVKAVIGSDPAITADKAYELREELAERILTELKKVYGKFYCEPLSVAIIDFDTPVEIDNAIAREQGLRIEERAEDIAIRIAEKKKTRRLKEGEAQAAFQQQVGKVTAEMIDLTRMENQKLWIETLREGIEKGAIKLVVTEAPVFLNVSH